MKSAITCIGCPMGCLLSVEGSGTDLPDNIKVSGHQCKIGVNYGREETTNPTRNIATSVRVDGGGYQMLSVKTNRPIPKGKIFECVKAVQAVRMKAPIKIGDIVLANAGDTGVDFVATREVSLL